MAGPLPAALMAYGWVPFLVVATLALVFSVVYVLYHRATRPRYLGTTIITILGLFLSLVCSLLVPVDVFVVSYMKTSDGNWKSWAETQQERNSITGSIQTCYYVCYSVILTFCFLLFPANFFYHGVEVEGEDDQEPTFYKKLCKSLQYTMVSLFLFGLLVVGGFLIPVGDHTQVTNLSDIGDGKVAWFVDKMEHNKFEDMLLFVLNVINLVGMLVLIVYTGVGLSSLPCSLVAARRRVDGERNTLQLSISELESQIAEIEGRSVNAASIPTFDQSQIDRLEQQLRLLRRDQRDLEQRAKNAINRCALVVMPCQLVAGAFFSGIGFLVFLSLLLENVDKALHSDGPRSGYAVHNSSLPNPLDLLLVVSSTVFPVDYVVYTGIVLFLVLSSMSGMKAVGIRFCWVSIYRIRAWKTHPRGLLLAVLSLMYIILAINVVMFSLLPDYTTFGNQHYVHTSPDNSTTVERCGGTNFVEKQDGCTPSRISVLLLSFHYKVWIFGAAYYWLTWTLLLVITLGSVFTVYRIRRPVRMEEEEEDLIST